ncbi:hypothetical protein Z196_01833, partial [Streptococcus pyogenes ABC020046158]
ERTLLGEANVICILLKRFTSTTSFTFLPLMTLPVPGAFAPDQ